MLTPDGKNLSYLFEVVYKDNSIFLQTPEDRSVKKEGRSAFFDVDQENIKEFHLVHCENGDQWSVNLETGLFEHNGQAFFVDEPLTQFIPEEALPAIKFRLIFYRQHQIKTNMKVTVNKDLKPEVDSYNDAGHTVRYVIGYQFTFVGKNYQRIISIMG